MNDNKVIVNFSKFPFCFRCTNIKKYDYTNYLSGEKEFFKSLKTIFEKEVPFFCENTFSDLQKKSHGHAIMSNTKEYQIVKEVIKKIVMDFKNFKNDSEFEMWFNQNINDYYIWQLGQTGGIRLIGIRNLNVFNVLFIDYHHLIFPDVKNNQKNYSKYKFCPITTYN